jgi:hypothetical protein
MDSCDDEKPVFFSRRISWQDQSSFLFPPFFECVEFRLHSFASKILTMKICRCFRRFTVIESCLDLNRDADGCGAIALEAENSEVRGEKLKTNTKIDIDVFKAF